MKFTNENKYPPQEVLVRYHAPRPINIGEVFYKIRAVDFQQFREPCVVCGDKKELTVNGVTFRCPCCGSTGETISINGYVVQRYRVFKITDWTNNSDWKPSDSHHVVFGIYRKVGHGDRCAAHSESTFNEYHLERRFNVSEVSEIHKQDVGDYLFDDYNLAVKVAKGLTDAEVRRLEEYNKAHGSNYVPVFRTEHDRKSS